MATAALIIAMVVPISELSEYHEWMERARSHFYFAQQEIVMQDRFARGYIFAHQQLSLTEFVATNTRRVLEQEEGRLLYDIVNFSPTMNSVYASFLDSYETLRRTYRIAVRICVAARDDEELIAGQTALLDLVWNVTGEPTYEVESAFDTTLFDRIYSYSEKDLNRTVTTAAMQKDIAANTVGLQRFQNVLDSSVTSLAELSSLVHSELKRKYDAESNAIGDRAFAAMAMSCVTIAMTVACGFMLIGSAIKRFSPTAVEAELYNSLFSGHMVKTLVAALVMALLFSAIFGAELLHVVNSNQAGDVVMGAHDRTFKFASAVLVVHQMEVTSEFEDLEPLQAKLRSILLDVRARLSSTYFGSATARRMRHHQDEFLFGPTEEDSFVVRSPGDSPTVCFEGENDVNGNVRFLQMQTERLLSHLSAIAYYPVDNLYLAFTDLSQGSGTTDDAQYISKHIQLAQSLYDSIMRGTKISTGRFEAAMRDDNTAFNAASLCLVAIAFVTVVSLYVLLFGPLVNQLKLEEAGTKQLLMMIPENVRVSIPEIVEYFQSGYSSTDEQLKHSLQQSEQLLQNILPPSISRRLKSGETLIADDYPCVTVVFAALTGFEEYGRNLDATSTVLFLNGMTCAFDHIVDLLELEKIKTIQEVYFFCGGLTKKTEQDHALRCMECALLFFKALEEHCQRYNAVGVSLRVGIHTGPCVAGVIGTKKVAYDLWGDTVNTASRMQSTGVAGRVQVSQSTHQLLAEHFAFDKREVVAKGKGQLVTYLANGVRKAASPYANINWHKTR